MHSLFTSDMRHWKNYIKPKPGETVWVLSEEGNIVTATYEESGFYRLELDNTVGCLRKMPVNVLFWRDLCLPES